MEESILLSYTPVEGRIVKLWCKLSGLWRTRSQESLEIAIISNAQNNHIHEWLHK